ncbi:type II pantothenate kinase [Paenibacillus sp. GCM10027626]|uniref:type II pantothenate kinase n=1 Tax=Paenibacillus sp. GCM10027626 TaxID=3273411 RepID=UPI00362BB5EF
MKIGIDAGGTLIKIAISDGGAFRYRKFLSSRLEEAASFVNRLGAAEIGITGGRAAMLQSYMKQHATEMLEFEATCRGVRHLLDQEGMLEQAYVVTNVGTGTSIHHVDRNIQQRLGGTGVGGGTLVGLARLLAGIEEYEEIIRLAAKGRRDRVDLKVFHIYEGKEPPIPGDLTASNFGNVLSAAAAKQYTKEELLAAVVGLVGETVATTSVLAAATCGVSSIIFIGSSFVDNSLLKEVVQTYTKLRGAIPIFIANGEYSGAMGAAL